MQSIRGIVYYTQKYRRWNHLEIITWSLLKISLSKITRVEKKLFDGFPMLQSLDLSHNSKLKTIDKDSFSNLKNLTTLLLFSNDLSEFDPQLILCLKNLENLSLGETNWHFLI